MLEKITSICYVLYHIRNEMKNQLKIQKTLCVMLENLTCGILRRLKSTYAIRLDNWYNILTIKIHGGCVWGKYILGKYSFVFV